MDTKKLTGMDTTGMAVDPIEEDVARGAAIVERVLGPSETAAKKGMVRMVSTPASISVDMSKVWSVSADDIRDDAVAMEQIRLAQRGVPATSAQAFKSMHLNEWSREPIGCASI